MLQHRFMATLVALLVAIALVLLGTFARAGTTGGLSGTVLESGQKTPVPNAKVTATSPSQSTSTRTDGTGHFSFLSLAPDTYSVSVEKQGYDSASLTGINVFADQTQTLSLNARRTLHEIGRVSSRAASDIVKPGTTADIYSVSAAQLGIVAGLGGGGALNSAYSAIASVPGTFIPQGQSGELQSVYVRGGNYTELGYEFDGVPIQRAFDQYPGSAVSALGQQELQVYTGAAPASSQSTGLAGFINQVIKTGTYPGYGEGDLGIGSPTFYHKAQVEFGGATADRNFSYYVGAAGYNQEYRYASQFDGAELDSNYSSSPYNIVAQNCTHLNASAGCYANSGPVGIPVGPSGYALGPYSWGIESQNADREVVANLHFGLPHRKDGGKDDIQLLFDNSYVRTYFPDAFLDWNYAARDVANGTATIGGVAFPNCAAVTAAGGIAAGPGVDGTACAISAGPAQVSYKDPSVYSGAVGVPLTAALTTKTKQYFSPYSATNRQPGANVPLSQRDTNDFRTGIFKAQYQKNIGSSAFFRLYGYTFYSDWLQNGASQIAQTFVVGPTPDYEIASHTRGLSFTFADQLNSKNLLNLTGGYTYASTTRWNNDYYVQPSGVRRVAVLVNANNPANGICYTAAAVPVYCGSTAVANYTLPGINSPVAPLVPNTHKGVTDPTIAAASAMTCGSGPCEYYTVESGMYGPYNSVAPRFSNLELADSYKPADRWLIDLGLRYDDFRYDLADTTLPAGPLAGPVNATARALFTNSYNLFHCLDLTTRAVTASATPGVCPAGTVPENTSTVSPGHTDYNGFQPRIGATYAASPFDVFRGSYGKYFQPASTAYEQYNGISNNLIGSGTNAAFIPLGFTAPTHTVYPEVAYNLDFSWEHQVKGSDVAFKLTPFLRKTANDIYTVVLDPKTGFISGVNIGRVTAKGAELLLRKGSFDRNGFAGQLGYTYTWATTRYQNLPTGATIVDGVNQSIKTYNAYTSACSGNTKNSVCGGGVDTAGNVTAACYTTKGIADPKCAAGDIANPYWNSAPNSLFSANTEYIAQNQLPGTGLSSVASSYNIPHVAVLLLNYKHDRIAVTPSLQMTAGGRYGSPVEGNGIDPASGCSPLTAGNVAADPRNFNGLPAGTTPAFEYDAQTCPGNLVAPDFATHHFDNFGEFVEPTQLTLNVQLRYEASKEVTVALTMANVMNRCFGGTKAPWTAGVPSNVACWYGSSTVGSQGNFYNPGTGIAPPAQTYSPTAGSVFQAAYGAQTNPFQAFLSVQVKM
jgi:outer membrane receptor protein involved in Fe transport